MELDWVWIESNRGASGVQILPAMFPQFQKALQQSAARRRLRGPMASAATRERRAARSFAGPSVASPGTDFQCRRVDPKAAAGGSSGLLRNICNAPEPPPARWHSSNALVEAKMGRRTSYAEASGAQDGHTAVAPEIQLPGPRAIPHGACAVAALQHLERLGSTATGGGQARRDLRQCSLFRARYAPRQQPIPPPREISVRWIAVGV